MAKLIGTAGHVDHGKTTLIRALTGIDADRLPEEKKRGMTIDIGFAYIDFPTLGRVSIVDVPGHEKFLTNMLVGALGIDVALLCVAADESVMPQTREHFQILELLPVERLVVAMTRADFADESIREFTNAEIEEMLELSRFKGSRVIPVSAESGEGLELLKQTLEATLLESERFSGGPWYLPIDRVFNVKGHGVVVTGTLAQGTVHEGEDAVLMPGSHKVRVRSIEWHDQKQASSEAGRRTALNLSGIKTEDVHRGLAVGAPGSIFETDCIDVRLKFCARPKHGSRVRLSIGADEVIGKIFLSDQDESLAQLRLERATAAAPNQPVIVRKYSPPDLIGGGRVLVPLAVRRRKGENVVLADTARADNAGAILSVVEKATNGIDTNEVCRILGKTPQALGQEFEELKTSGELLGFAGLWLTIGRFEEASNRLLDKLAELHEKNPARAGIPREKAVEAAALGWTGKPLDRILAYLAQKGHIIVSGSDIRRSDFVVRLNPRQRELLDRVAAELNAAGINVPDEAALAQAMKVPKQAVMEILDVGIQAKEIVRITEGVFYTCAQIEEWKRQIIEISQGNPFTAAQVRDATGSTRKYVIPLLEYFDSVRFTVRLGESRVVN